VSDVEAEPIFEFEGGSYEWYSLAVYRHPNQPQRYAVFSGTGCSCNYFKKPTELEVQAREPLPRAEIRRLVTAFISNNPHHINSGSALRYLERFEDAMNAKETA
jgi:hypothetical protein